MGCLLVDPRHVSTTWLASLRLRTSTQGPWRGIFRTVSELHTRGEPVDIVLIHRQLEQCHQLEHMGGMPRIVELMGMMPDGAYAAHYAGIIREDADRRRAMDALRDGFNALQDRSVDVSEATGSVPQAARCRRRPGLREEPVAVRHALVEMFNALDAAEEPATATGWPDLNAVLSGGIRPGQLVILAARPSVGKTALAANLALHLTQCGKPALFVSLEQPRVELVERIASSVSGIPHARIRERRLEPEGSYRPD
ncbi:MAG: DnaB-like helicase C-terminal domain-containing protein [Planctomycetaceae bacterium]